MEELAITVDENDFEPKIREILKKIRSNWTKESCLKFKVSVRVRLNFRYQFFEKTRRFNVSQTKLCVLIV